MERELLIKHVRIAGNRDARVRRIGACFGTPGGVFELLASDDVDMILTGEACEWKLCEYARDAAALGMNKSMLVMGHIGSERDGMRLLADDMTKKYQNFETRYFECGEVYTYTEEGV
jgi:putative NIF3 family GTP cyclohydrolase 1 type 2